MCVFGTFWHHTEHAIDVQIHLGPFASSSRCTSLIVALPEAARNGQHQKQVEAFTESSLESDMERRALMLHGPC